jgi:ATP-dependent Clp endopeptidase proteolytic subunit ClpP
LLAKNENPKQKENVNAMFKLEKTKDKAILTIYGYVGGIYMDYRKVSDAISEVNQEGYTQLDFHLHSYGGIVFDGNMIYNQLALFKGEIDVYIDGVAASMGSVLMLVGDRIHIAENGFVMIHAPSGGAYGNARDMLDTAKLLRSIEKQFREILKKRTGKAEQVINDWMGGDTWFDADEAIEAGLCDDKYTPRVQRKEEMDKKEVVQLGAEGAYRKLAAQFNNPKSNEMNKKELIELHGLTSVTEESTDEQIKAAIKAKLAQGQAAQEKAENDRKAAIKAAVKKAKAEGKIKADQTEKYEAYGEKLGLEELNAIFADMQVYNPISGNINKKEGEGKKQPEDRSNWDFDAYQEKDPEALEKMPYEEMNALYKAKYGTDAPK